MGLLDNVSPQQKKLLMYGAPAVALLALGLRLGRGGNSAAPAADAPAPTTTGTLSPLVSGASTGVLGTGNLADFESAITGALGGLADAVNQLNQKEPTTTATTPPPIYPTFAPNPNGPGSYCNNCPAGRIPIAGASGWTCATLQEANAIAAYVGSRNG